MYRWIAAAWFLLCAASSCLAGIARDPYLQNVTQDGVTIMWATASTTGSGTVHYGTTLGSYPDSAASTNASGIHTARISGLSPDQTCYYTVEADGETVGQDDADYHFKTAPPDGASFRFVVYGDSRNNASIHGLVVDQIRAQSPALVIHTGDITGDAGIDEYDPQFFVPAAELLRNTPMFLTVGNHEYSPVSNYYDLYDLPSNNPAGTEAYYSFDYGPAHFVCLNTEFLPGGHEDDPAQAAAQTAWLHADLSASTRPWTFVYFHRPPFSSGGHGGWEPALTALVPIFEQYHVTMVFGGHNHLYDAYRKSGVYYIVAGGGGAPPVPAGSDPPHQIFEDQLYPHYHACVLDVTADGVEMQAIDADGVFHRVVAPGHYLWLREKNGFAGHITADPDLLIYETDTEVTLAATVGMGFDFKHWEVYDPNHLHDANYAALDANETLTIVMNADRKVVAVFGCGPATRFQLLLGVGALALIFVLRRR